ncbi:MAG TPA: heavy metal-binding domain-containing protein [Tepidisphaeraceae bacterium]|nr:heavy metal-binding domain-containing protein [Tepidisphaeraceae bacterium]
MFPRPFLWGLAAALLVGCAAEPPVRPLAMNDPSNPNAPEAPMPASSDTLAMNKSSDNQSSMSQDAGGMSPDMPDMKHDMPSMNHDMPGMNHNMSGMDMRGMKGMHDMPGMPPPATRAADAHELYTCKMHPKVISDKPGNCPICGMRLIKKPAPAQKEMNK